MNTNTITRNILYPLGGLFMLAAANLGAAPLHVQLDGNILGGTGAGAALSGTAMFADLYFDLDEGNALEKQGITPAGELPFTRWTFSGGDTPVAPYNLTSFTAFTAGFGTFANPVFLDVETLDNFDADANGKPFGITGIVDVFSVFATTDIVDCSNGFNDPVTGCSDPDAPVVEGETHAVNFIASSSWFTGSAVLPTNLLPFGDFLGVFGSVERTVNGALVDTAEVQYTSKRLNGPAAVPAPQTLLLMLTGLLAMAARRPRKRS